MYLFNNYIEGPLLLIVSHLFTSILPFLSIPSYSSLQFTSLPSIPSFVLHSTVRLYCADSTLLIQTGIPHSPMVLSLFDL